MDNVSNTLCTVITGYVSGYNEKHASLTPQKRKRARKCDVPETTNCHG